MNGAITVQEAIDRKEGRVRLRGWVYRERGSNEMRFIVLRDGTNIIQCVLRRDEVGDEVFDAATRLQIEASIILEGDLKPDDRAPTGVELVARTLEVVGKSDQFPITKDQSAEFLLDNRHLWIRSRTMNAVLKIRAMVLRSWREYYDGEGFLEFSPPILQPSQSEGGSILFEVKYYQDITYLTQSWQLYGEAAIFSYERLYCISPCFRAEKSKTSRHLSEFWMAEMEAAWYELPEMLDSIEGCIKHIVRRVVEDCGEELKILGRDPARLMPTIEKPFERITYAQALEILKEKDGMEVPWGKDLRTLEEEALVAHYDVPVIVTHYPREAMAFYKPPAEDDEETSLCVDVLAPEGYGEIIGGSQRDLDIDRMSERLKAEGEDPANYEWYFDLRRYGSVPHSGYGLGVERLIAWVCGLENIKDAIPFPRTMRRWRP